MRNIDLFKDYENAYLVKVAEYQDSHAESTCYYDEIGTKNIDGIPIAVTRSDGGRLKVSFIPDTHLLAIGATRSGKTTGYVIPTINILLQKKNKPSLVISDPKGELYTSNAKKFEDAGYKVLLLDFTNYYYSDCWNPLTKLFRLYQKSVNTEKEVQYINTTSFFRAKFNDIIFTDRDELRCAIQEAKENYYDEVEKGITSLVNNVITSEFTKDPFWEESARDLLAAILYAMLEDSEKGIITEETFSFETVLRIFDSFSDAEADYSGYDRGYFSKRPDNSKAFALANRCILEQANNTRRCIASAFATKMNKFRDTSVRRITCTNTFEMSELDDGRPTVIFVCYKDEESLHYEVISMFLTNLYTELISIARKKNSRLDRPFYFLLDEFGNLPQFNDFDKVISACGGRNIWFLLVLQSYAQLANIYGEDTANIIKDNLNTHIFFGTNNPDTKTAFSNECGKKTVISPLSALNGEGETIRSYSMDSVALVPVSMLDRLKEGECIVTQMRSDVLLSVIERSYNCPEFNGESTHPSARGRQVNFSDPKFKLSKVEPPRPEKKTSSNPFNF